MDDYVNLSGSINISDYTFLAWVKSAPSARYDVIARNTIASGYGIEPDTNPDGSFRVRFDTSIQSNQVLGSGVNIKDNNYHFIGVTFLTQNNEAVSYVDGIKRQSLIVNGTLPIYYTWNTIGHYGWGSYWPGLIDEVRIYNRALSDAEIKALYEATK